MRRARRAFAVIAGGGTGGHVTPAIAIARALVARGYPPEAIHFVGARRGVEARLVPEAGFPLTLLPGRGVERRLGAASVAAVLTLLVALVRGAALVARRRPAVVVSVGGYASLPCSVAAVLLRVPLVLAEQNAHPGAAQRVVARFARAVAVAFPGTPLPRAVVTGNPVRPEILGVDRTAGRAAARRALGLPPDRRVVAVFGGSQGARTLNEAVLGALREWSGRRDLALRHVVGERDWESVVARAPRLPAGGLLWLPVRFESRMDLLYAAADLAVCRSGSSSISELTVAGLPAVLVPFPHATGDHQTANARVVADAGGAVLVADADLSPARLVAEVDTLLADPAALARMGEAARTLGRPDAADRVADLVVGAARD